MLNAGDQACYEISVLGPEAQANDRVLDAGDQAYDDVTFMLSANAKVDDDQFVLDAVDQNHVDDDSSCSTLGTRTTSTTISSCSTLWTRTTSRSIR